MKRKRSAAALVGERERIVVHEEFRDDHLPCVKFKYNGLKLLLWWTDSKTIGALYFPASLGAQAHLKTLLDLIDSKTKKELKSDDPECDDSLQTDFGFIELSQEDA